jgi:NAD(P)-dependent dehydrogenase (short-subunit alcohol dehydrogenase family)
MAKLTFDDLAGKTAVVTGGAGIIGSMLCRALAQHGVKTAVLDLDGEKAHKVAESIGAETGTLCRGVESNVLARVSLDKAQQEIESSLGPVDILVNCAGGNKPSGTTGECFATPQSVAAEAQLFHDLDIEGFRGVFDLNVLGTVLPCQVFMQSMAQRGAGAVLNVSSMTAFRPLTKVGAYGAAKAAVSNLTQWLSVHYAKVNIRVNAIAPGFLLTDQNRYLLIDRESGQMTPRGKAIIDHTPMGRMGETEEVAGAALFLLSDMARFITGVVLPIDGGFAAYSGV